MKRYSFPRKILAVLLCMSLLLASSSCKKKKTQDLGERGIKESDPFFESEVSELKFPIDESKKLEYMSIDSIRFLGQKILASYIIQYEFPEADPETGYLTDIQWEEYSRQGTAMFSMEGEYLGEMVNNDAFGLPCIAVDNDGNIATLSMNYNENYQVDGLKIVSRDDSGNTVKEIDLQMPPSSDLQYVTVLQFLPDGKIAVQSSYTAPVYIFDASGKYLFNIASVERGVAGEIFLHEGKYYAFSMPTDWFGTLDYYIHEIDMTTGEMKPGKKANGIVNISALTYGEDGVYTSTPNGISKYNPVSGEMEEVFDWNETDVNRRILSSVRSFPINENEIHAIATEYNDSFINYKYYVLNLKRAKSNPHAGKKILYVGGLGLSSGFYDYMYEYNADTSHDCRIEAFDYLYSLEDGTSLDEQFYTNITNRINLMLLSGEAPDILVNFAGYDQYANDAMLVDLNTYIDSGKGLDRSEYFDNIFRSMEVNGKLYYIPMSFALEGYLANTQYLDADTNWTFDDMDRAAEALPDGMLMIPPTESTDLLKKYMGSDLTTYMDYANKKVNFNSEGMIRVFEEVKKYAAKEDLSDRSFLMGLVGTSSYGGLKVYDTSDFSGLGGSKPVVKLIDYLRYDQSAMVGVEITDLNDYSLYLGIAEGNGKFIGYPSLHGNGVMAQSGESMAIFAGSPYKDEAWEVIRSFFSKEAQTSLTSGIGRGFPLNISAFDENMQAEKEKINGAYTEFQKDVSQNEVWNVILYPVEDGQVEELKGIIENAKSSYHTDEAVMSVIMEEAPGYFEDTRSAEEVLKNIDNRALLIVQER
ncbi:MAG: extracellular solute-binding protein [Clostridiales bacterium]|nr:extracellular solute-binding protein [Clostridiales bacterium]